MTDVSDLHRKDTRHRYAVFAVAAAVVSGLLADLLVWRVDEIGIGALLWFVGAIAVVLVTVHRADRWFADRHRLWLIGVAAVMSLVFVVRDSEFVLAVDLAVMAIVIALAISPTPKRLVNGSLESYLGAGFTAGVGLLILPVAIAFDSLQWRRLIPSSKSAWGPWARGALLALPLLVVFVALFSTADRAFAKLIGDLLNFSLADVVEHSMVVLLFGWPIAAAAYLVMCRGFSYLPEAEAEAAAAVEEAPAQRVGKLGRVEVGVVLGALNILFATFVTVQVRYLFGGHQLVQQRTGLTYAEYARRGFVELVIVAALTLGVLIVLDHVRHRGARREEVVYRSFGGVLLALLAVVMVSAIVRLRIYEQAYGLTELRLLVFFFLAWIAAVIVWFVIVLVRDRRANLAIGSLVAGLAIVGCWNLLNPAAFVANRNLDKVHESRASSAMSSSYDVSYATSLSADAVPTLVNGLEEMPPAKRRRTARALLNQWDKPGEGDWRAFNTSRRAARRSVERHMKELRAAAE